LIGGAPLVGKTALAGRLSASLGYACISTDDLGVAAQSVTSMHSHPQLHYMRGADYRWYYASQDIVQLIMDAERFQEAIWPAIERTIHDHATWSPPAVIEGWALQPERVVKLPLTGLASMWLVASEEVYEQRLRNDREFLQGAPDVEKLIRQFVRRSLWYDQYLRQIAPHYRLPLLEVSPATTPEDLVAAATETIGLSPVRESTT
jgi:2-phosphoglycerate kinase